MKQNQLLKKEIWDRLSKGKFICANSQEYMQRQLYNSLLENEDEYRSFFAEIGYTLDHGRDYYQFCRDVSADNIDNSLNGIKKYLVLCNILKAWREDFFVGLDFRKTSFLEAIAEDPDLLMKVREFSKKENYKEIVNDILSTLRQDGFIERVSDDEAETYFVTSAFNYIEDIFNNTIIYNEGQDNETSE
ncbi:MAG: DUF4194 domain-containing protein [Prevotella sp.]|nr:DUF4194 domain-containing protein [Prevotella sp.]